MTTPTDQAQLKLSPENHKTWIGVLVEIFDKICKMDLVEMNYLKKRIEEAQKADKDGLEWSYSVLDKTLNFAHKACFKGIWGGFKGYKQVKHLEIDMQAMLDAAKARTLPGYENLMTEVLEASQLYKNVVKKYGEFTPMVMPGDLCETGSSGRIVLFFKDKETVLAQMAEGTANFEILKTA